jgi:hypothetical protein
MLRFAKTLKILKLLKFLKILRFKTMNVSRSFKFSDARRMMFFLGLLTVALTGFFLLTKQAAMQSEMPLPIRPRSRIRWANWRFSG